ncbi:hypothetical protein HU137_07650 [Moheibacter sp. BDHS18]|uniref:Uncharacterized protein n=2 Tax=Moheibacter lacus TaxID=2745851 RepID=A0A838ZRW5_9FLAO|nr:hypothetical protein [Moheibacter lacus]
MEKHLTANKGPRWRGFAIRAYYNYEYDTNGNMTKDRNKTIESIICNHLNLSNLVNLKMLIQSYHTKKGAVKTTPFYHFD